MKLNKTYLGFSSAFLLLVIGYLFSVSAVLAAPTQNPPNGGVIQITPSATVTPLVINAATGAITTGIWNGTPVSLIYGGTGRAITDSASKTAFRNDVLAAQGNGQNDDITAFSILNSITSNTSLALNAGGSNQNITLTPSGTGYTILNGKVGIGIAIPLSTLHVRSSGNAFERLDADTGGYAGLQFNTGSTVNWTIQRPPSTTDLRFNDGSADRLTLKNGGNITIAGTLDLGANKITNVAAPTASSDAATKGYVDAAAGGCSGSPKATNDTSPWNYTGVLANLTAYGPYASLSPAFSQNGCVFGVSVWNKSGTSTSMSLELSVDDASNTVIAVIPIASYTGTTQYVYFPPVQVASGRTVRGRLATHDNAPTIDLSLLMDR